MQSLLAGVEAQLVGQVVAVRVVCALHLAQLEEVVL
jgi:hypothetical protein